MAAVDTLRWNKTAGIHVETPTCDDEPVCERKPFLTFIHAKCDDLVALGVSEEAVAPIREWAREQERG